MEPTVKVHKIFWLRECTLREDILVGRNFGSSVNPPNPEKFGEIYFGGSRKKFNLAGINFGVSEKKLYLTGISFSGFPE